MTKTQAIMLRLRDMPEVEYVEPDRLMQHMKIPGDTHYANQWHYKASSDLRSVTLQCINAAEATLTLSDHRAIPLPRHWL